MGSKTPEFSVKATVDGQGMIALPMPGELELPVQVVYSACLFLASQGKCRIRVSKDGEIVYSKS